MKRPYLYITAALFAVWVLSLSAQTEQAQAQTSASSGEGVFAPFVAHIKATVKEGQVVLSWSDSRDARGPLVVFRSPEPITAARLSRTVRLAEVPYGAQSYIDKPASSGPWYYYVAAADENKKRFDILLPFSNMTGSPVMVSGIAATVPVTESATSAETTAPAVSSAGTGSTAPARTTSEAGAVTGQKPIQTAQNSSVRKPSQKRLSGISAKVQGDAVYVSVKAETPVDTVLVYRSAAPILGTADLLDAVIVLAASSVSAPFVDYPVPGISYYYALIPEDELKAGQVFIERGTNSTVSAVEIPAGRYRVGLPGPPRDIRAIPLPLISMDSAMPDGSFAPAPPAIPVPLSPAASKALAELSRNVKSRALPERRPRAFPQDLEIPAGGEEYALRSIVQGPFAKRDWSEAAKQISRFLSLSRSPSSEARAHYYLGQAYFFLGQHREALFEFLLAQSQYYAEGQEWVDAILPRLVASVES